MIFLKKDESFFDVSTRSSTSLNEFVNKKTTIIFSENTILRQCLVFLMLLCLCTVLNDHVFAEKISLKGTHISYIEAHQIVIASGNAMLTHPSFKIVADKIFYDQKTNLLTGINNVELIQEDQIILSDSFEFDTSTNEIQINNLLLEVSTSKTKQIFVTATSLSDYGLHKKGTNAVITTCENSPPHYYFEAKSFTIYPEKRIIAQDVRLINPVFNVPLGFWSPAYIFELGRRKVIYLMPVFGTNKVEGTFFKNQVDYVINDNLIGEAYIDYMSKRGIGLGSKVIYDNYDNIEGDVFYYGVSDANDNTQEWNQTYKITPDDKLTTKLRYKTIPLFSGNESKTTTQYVGYQKTTDSAVHNTSYNFNQSDYSSTQTKRYSAAYSIANDDGSSAKINANKSKSSIISESLTFQNKQKIGHDIESNNTISYSQQELSSIDKRKDSNLRTQNSLTKSFEGVGSLTTAIDYSFDTDQDTVTKDISNHIIQKIPELTFNFSSYKLNDHWSVNQTVQYGYYKEYYFLNQLNEQRVYSQSRVKLNQSITGTYKFGFLNSQLTSKWAYDQFLYGSGDQTYSLSHNLAYTTDSFSFLKTNTKHTRIWKAKDGNTPFYFDERQQVERDLIQETLTLYWISPTKYAFNYSTGYDFILHYQLDNQYSLSIKPNKRFSADFKTTYYLRQHRYSPLSSTMRYTPNSAFNTSLQTTYDLNTGDITNINHNINVTTSSKWEDRWIISAYFTASPKYHRDYELQTLSATKDLHRRQLTIMYNRILEEFRFQFSINAFPENKIGFKTNEQESFKLEGVLDGQSIQR